MTKTASFTQAQITRAIKAARNAGMASPAVELDPQGRMVIFDRPLANTQANGQPLPASDSSVPQRTPLEVWKSLRS